MSVPRNNIWPFEGRTNPVSASITVVLPAPLGPMRPCTSRRRMSIVTSLTASVVPKRTDNSRICRPPPRRSRDVTSVVDGSVGATTVSGARLSPGGATTVSATGGRDVLLRTPRSPFER